MIYNNFFHINEHYIYIYLVNKNYKYKFDFIDNLLYLFISNKDINREDTFKLKIMTGEKECLLKFNNIKSNVIKIGELEKLVYINSINFSNSLDLGDYIIYEKVTDTKPMYNYYIDKNSLHIKKTNETVNINLKIIIYSKKLLKTRLLLIEYFNENEKIIDNIDNYLENDIININNIYLENNYEKIYPNFDHTYYAFNNNNINLCDKTNKKFILYHWHFFGRYDQMSYFKYLLRKHKNIITDLPYPKVKYIKKNKNTLLFIDDRYDMSFIYLLQLFLYSVDKTWNINIYTVKENKNLYESDLKKLGISGKVNILSMKFGNIQNYSRLLKDVNFWKSINEDNALLFQYDSFCMGKFDKKFFDYNYIGAMWDHNASIFNEILIGNGGTSFRKCRIMEYLCEKYKNKQIKKQYPEDVYFSELLYEEKLYNYDTNIANLFSFENKYYEESIYAHQIYKSISMEHMDDFIYNKLIKLK